MKIELNELKKLVAQIINEGFTDDLKELQRLHPREADALSDTPFFDPRGQPTKWFKWLLPRFLTGRIKEDFAFDHVVDTIQRYAQNERALNDAFRQQAFKEALAAANLNKISDPSQLNVREMDSILEVFSEYNEKKNDRLGIDYDAIDVEGDRLAKIGPWNIWMPTTRENSCAIVRVRDPRTGKMKASPCSWCTIRTDGSNLFYNYAADPDADIVLYYLIKDNPEIYNKENEDFISIGFENGEMVAEGETAGITVSCDNSGLTERDLRRIFGANYTSIINFLSKKTDEIEGQHPAKSKMLAATESLEGLNYFIKGIGREERAIAASKILRFGQYNGIEPDVERMCFEYVSDSKEEKVLSEIIDLYDCPPHILEKIFYNKNDELCVKALKHKNFPKEIKDNWELLINHESEKVKIWVADNHNCPPEILEKLLDIQNNVKNFYIQFSIASNHNCTPKAFEKLINNDPNVVLQKAIIKNPKCPPHIIEKIIDTTKNFYVLLEIAASNNSKPQIFEKLLFNLKNINVDSKSYHRDESGNKISIIIEIIKNLNCTPEILEKLSNIKNMEILMNIAENRKTLPITFKKLYEYNDYGVKKAIAQNMSSPLPILEKLIDEGFGSYMASANHHPQIFEKLSINDNSNVRKAVASSLNCPPHILENLSVDVIYEVRLEAIKNLNFPAEKLKELSKGRHDYTTQNAIRFALGMRRIQLEFLRRKISKLIHSSK